VEKLPYDSYALAPVSDPIGGAVVLAANYFMYFSQNTRYLLALNEFADSAVFPLGTF
jgi:hypothetical protein